MHPALRAARCGPAMRLSGSAPAEPSNPAWVLACPLSATQNEKGHPMGGPFRFVWRRGGDCGVHPCTPPCALRAAGQPAAVRFCSCRTVEPRVGSRLPALGQAKRKGPPDGWPFSFCLAERGGFEPPRRYKRLPDFESGTFNRSATSPVSPAYRGRASYEEVAGFTSRHVQESETLLTPQLVGSSCHRDDGVLPAAPSFSCATP